MKIFGREKQISKLKSLVESKYPEFNVVYGRRRIGKTFLIREFFENNFFFDYTGNKNITNQQEVRRFSKQIKSTSMLNNWDECFDYLKQLIINSQTLNKKVVFLDEISWLDKHKSGFINSLEYFWNHFASSRSYVLLIICGSATNWIDSKIFRQTGGLYNRITSKIYLEPFSLKECEDYLKSNNINYNRFTLTEAYMVFGGVLYYYSLLDGSIPLEENIDNLIFNRHGELSKEYITLITLTFDNYKGYLKVLKALSSKNIGLCRKEIIDKAKISNGGGLSKILNDLELCGFIGKYCLGFKNKTSIFQIIDNLTLFCFHFLYNKPSNLNSHFWLSNYLSPKLNLWRGYAFEMVCCNHFEQIKNSLQISGLSVNLYGYRSREAQIDLVLDRADGVISLIEIKYTSGEFEITKDYDLEIRNKITSFINSTKTKKNVHLIILSTFGVKRGPYSTYQQLMLDDLFTNV